MGTRAWVVVAILVVAMPAVPACATRQVRLQMTREITLIPPVISDLKIDPSGQVDTRGQGRTVEVTLTGDPELQATFDLKGGPQGQEMKETQPGVYVGSFQVRPNETGRVDVVAHLLHSPTGSKQDISRDGVLVLVSSEDQRSECAPAKVAEFEEQLPSSPPARKSWRAGRPSSRGGGLLPLARDQTVLLRLAQGQDRAVEVAVSEGAVGAAQRVLV